MCYEVKHQQVAYLLTFTAASQLDDTRSSDHSIQYTAIDLSWETECNYVSQLCPSSLR